ncbi:MAG: hypothetical protein M0037_14620 [Betaproteobacteria bacterium]|nr:hypothetical protein [Betaproteobacteria bacterium]
MNVAVLNTESFADRQTVEEALSELEVFHEVHRWDVTRTTMSDEDWNQVLDTLLASDVVVTL